MLIRRSALSVAAVVLTLAGIAAAPAMADPTTCDATDGDIGDCKVTVPGGGGGGDNGAPDAPAQGCHTKDGTAVPCRSGGAFWSNSYECYMARVVPQPAKTEPVWKGHDDGVIMTCGPLIGPPVAVWVPSAPDVPNPEDLAREAVESMRLRAVGIGIVPEPRPGSVGVIGLPTWMWVADAGPTTLGPLSRTASSDGYSVTATAKVSKVVWNMGDGTKVTCTGRGTPYADSYGRRSSPTCGHTYTRQGRYTVTATSYWTIRWAGLGATGTIDLQLRRSTQITMGEVQVLVQ